MIGKLSNLFTIASDDYKPPCSHPKQIYHCYKQPITTRLEAPKARAILGKLNTGHHIMKSAARVSSKSHRHYFNRNLTF